MDGKAESEKYIKLNVGGHLFQTTIDTLTRGDTMLSAMFSGRLEALQDTEGFHLIDRSGKLFSFILGMEFYRKIRMINCRFCYKIKEQLIFRTNKKFI